MMITDNKIVMKNIKRKTENTPSGYLEVIFQERCSYHNINLKGY